MGTTFRLAAVLVVLTLSLSLYALQEPAKDTSPKSPAAVAALAKLDAAKRKAAEDYQAAVRAAAQQATQQLEANKQAQMKAGNLAEANSIEAAIAKLAADLQQPVGSDLASKIAARKWSYNGTSAVITYLPNGTAESKAWGGKPGTWRQLDSNSIEQTEPGGAIITITFDANFTHSLWVYHGKSAVAYAVAQ